MTQLQMQAEAVTLNRRAYRTALETAADLWTGALIGWDEARSVLVLRLFPALTFGCVASDEFARVVMP